MPGDDRRMTFIVVPHGGGVQSTRSFEISYRRLRMVLFASAAVGAALLLMALSWFWVAAQASRVPGLRREIASLEKDRQRVEQLSRVVARMEAQYEQVRMMLGGDVRPPDSLRAVAGDSAAGDSASASDAESDSAASPRAALPSAWPLAARGYVTRDHLARVPGRHPGIDIAVAAGSRILAAGGGTVLEAGEDTVYGRYVRIAHAGGYESWYGHASRVLVHARDRVRPRQVIALSGSTGASTAPHLHFEIRKDGRPVDPTTLVRKPE